MRRFCTYARLHFKRTLRYAPFVIVVMLVLCLCLSVAVFTLINVDNSDEDQKKIKVGLVGDFEGSVVGIGIDALTSFDSSKSFLDVVELENEGEARDALFDGEISAYIIIPDEFVDKAIDGRVGKLNFVTLEADVNIVNLFKSEVLNLISSILVESQNGIYGIKNLLKANGFTKNEINNMTNEMVVEYVSLIISRSNALELEVVGISENLTFAGYMYSGITVLLLLLGGIVFVPLFIRRDYALPKLMSANRCGACAQTVGEFLPFFVVMTVTSVVFFFAMMLGVGRFLESVPELSSKGIGDMILILVRFIPSIALITALQYLLYQFSDSIISGVMIQFVSAVLLGYLSGCFYPISFFPKVIRVVSDFLPSGAVRGYFSSLLTETASVSHVLIIAVYTVLLLGLSAFVKRWRIKAA